MDYDLTRAIAELKKLKPNAEELKFGETSCLHYQTVVPAHTFDFVVLLREHDLLVVRARGSFNRELAANIVKFCEGRKSETGIKVFDGFSSPGYSFDCITLAAPSISRCFSSESEYLAEIATWAFPSFACEFRTDPDGENFDFLLGKGSRIEAIDWNREPTPQARIRLLTDWPGGLLRKRKNLGIVHWEAVIGIGTKLPLGEVVVIANLEDKEIRISSTCSGFDCSGSVCREQLSADDLAHLLKEFFLLKT